jgi:hypothetical protein
LNLQLKNQTLRKKEEGKFSFFLGHKKRQKFLGEKKRKTLLRLPTLQNSNTTRNFLQSALLGALLLALISVPFCFSTCRSCASLELPPAPLPASLPLYSIDCANL